MKNLTAAAVAFLVAVHPVALASRESVAVAFAQGAQPGVNAATGVVVVEPGAFVGLGWENGAYAGLVWHNGVATFESAPVSQVPA